MPQGIILIGWDRNKGAIVEYKHPDWIPIPDNEVMAIYNAHTLGGRRPGKVQLNLRLLKVVSYYTGKNINKCVSLILDKSENPSIYFEHIDELLEEWINNSVGLKYQDIPKIYKKFQKLSEAQSAVEKIIKFF